MPEGELPSDPCPNASMTTVALRHADGRTATVPAITKRFGSTQLVEFIIPNDADYVYAEDEES